jgi:hypothetical protein
MHKRRIVCLILGLLLVFLAPVRAIAQTAPAPIDSLRLTRLIPFDKPGAASADPAGLLYVADALQNVVQLAPDGKRQQTYSAPVRGRVAALDAGFTGKVLAFYDDRQALTIFDRFLSPITAIQFADFPATAERLIRAATLAPDGTIWLYDERQLTLVRLDPRDPGAAMTVPLDLVLTSPRSDIRALHAYQNKLYLLDRATGLYVFDIFGAFIRKIALPGLAEVYFSRDELFFLTADGSALQFESLYAAATSPRLLRLPKAPGGHRWVRLAAGAGGELYLLSAVAIGVAQLPK